MGNMFPLIYEVTGEQVREAAEVVSRYLGPTPLVLSEPLSERLGRPVWLKCEHRQVTGSFKVRGALTRLSRLRGETARRGVVAASAGNHGLGVGWACRVLGVPGLVVVPEATPRVKLDALRETMVKVRLHGACYDEAEARARAICVEAEATWVSPFDDPWVMAGNGGTVGLEILEQCPEVGAVLAPVGGGGLCAGLATALPGVPVVGYNTGASPAMARSIAGGEVLLTYDAAPTIAEGLEGGVTPGSAALCQRLLHSVQVVPEVALRRAVAFMATRQATVIEGSSAPPVAALLEGMPVPGEGPAVVVITGRNIDRDRLKALVVEAGMAV